MLKLKILACMILVTAPVVAYAEIDCSGATQHTSRNYKKGDRVFVRDSSGRKIYSCEKDQCSATPSADNSGWKYLGLRIGGGAGDCK
jgi:hypothetical protein